MLQTMHALPIDNTKAKQVAGKEAEGRFSYLCKVPLAIYKVF